MPSGHTLRTHLATVRVDSEVTLDTYLAVTRSSGSGGTTLLLPAFHIMALDIHFLICCTLHRSYGIEA